MNGKVTLNYISPSKEVTKTGETLVKHMENVEDESVCRYFTMIRFKGIKKKSIRRGYVQRAKSMDTKHIPHAALIKPCDNALDVFFENWAKHLVNSDPTSENHNHES